MTYRTTAGVVLSLFVLLLLLAGVSTLVRKSHQSTSPAPPQIEESALMPPETTDPTPPKYTNRLAGETSPYLLQHAHNPVDWYPWGEEAFEKARREQKIIFLSIGYSTCYWCHVMERESFEDEATAAFMNEHFVCIKVDREERPDVDDVYMAAVQIQTGGGGWPMSVFLLPPPAEDGSGYEVRTGLAPVYSGTYFPPEPKFNRPSFHQVLDMIQDAWHTRRGDMIAQAQSLQAAVVQQLAAQTTTTPVGEDQVRAATDTLLRIFDPLHGGFGKSPKFPQPVFVEHLLDTLATEEDEGRRTRITRAIRQTLDCMATGGMYDQVGGGFHRYSTDEKWLVPHFEKMLYDNGQLAGLYARASETFDDPFYAEIAGEICGYVLREMTDPDTGAFYSAQDAEVNRREGQNYLWTPDQITATLEAADIESKTIDLILDVYGLGAGLNFRDPHHPNDPPANVIYLTARPDELATRAGMPLDEFNAQLRQVNAILFEERQGRDQPIRDDKIIAAWNGLMIVGMAETGRVLERPDLVAAAERAWAFINSTMRDESGGLLRTSRGGRAKVPAFCEDYAMLAHGLVALSRATNNEQYLGDATRLMDDAQSLFGDAGRGGYFDTRLGTDDLFVRPRSAYDGAVPSANGMMLANWVELHTQTSEPRFLDHAITTLRALSPDIDRSPVASINATRRLHTLLRSAPDRVATMTSEANEQPQGPVQITWKKDSVVLNVEANTVAAVLRFSVDAGYHLNAHEPGDANLIGLDIQLADPGEEGRLQIEYPRGEVFTLGDQPIRVYTGNIEIPIKLTHDPDKPLTTNPPSFTIRYQVCTDEVCLAPEEVRRSLP